MSLKVSGGSRLSDWSPLGDSHQSGRASMWFLFYLVGFCLMGFVAWKALWIMSGQLVVIP